METFCEEGDLGCRRADSRSTNVNDVAEKFHLKGLNRGTLCHCAWGMNCERAQKWARRVAPLARSPHSSTALSVISTLARAHENDAFLSERDPREKPRLASLVAEIIFGYHGTSDRNRYHHARIRGRRSKLAHKKPGV